MGFLFLQRKVAVYSLTSFLEHLIATKCFSFLTKMRSQSWWAISHMEIYKQKLSMKCINDPSIQFRRFKAIEECFLYSLFFQKPDKTRKRWFSNLIIFNYFEGNPDMTFFKFVWLVKDLNLSYEDAIFIKILNTKYDFQINNLLKKHC